MHEILQSFRDAKYITSLDLRQVFLQIMLAKSSRKYTAFQFENKVCQFTRIPYGMRNTLSGLTMASHLVLEANCSEDVKMKLNIYSV
jgi:hypothetical protein